MERRPRAHGLALNGAAGDRLERVLRCRGELDILHLEESLVLLDERVLRLGQDLDKRHFIEVLEQWPVPRDAAENSGMRPKLEKVFRSTSRKGRRCACPRGAATWR